MDVCLQAVNSCRCACKPTVVAHLLVKQACVRGCPRLLSLAVNTIYSVGWRHVLGPAAGMLCWLGRAQTGRSWQVVVAFPLDAAARKGPGSWELSPAGRNDMLWFFIVRLMMDVL